MDLMVIRTACRFCRLAASLALGWLLLTPIVAHAQTVPVRVEVEGIDDAARDNVLSALSLRMAAQDGPLRVERIRRLNARAPGEIERALQAFGFYRPQIESELVPGADQWVARYRVDAGAAIRVRRIDVRLLGEGENDPNLQELVARFPLSRGNVLHHGPYQSGKSALRARAVDRGYLDARFDKSEISVDLDAYAAEITLHLNTGPRFLFGPVEFNQDVLQSAVLMAYVPFRPGDPYDVSRLLRMQSALSASPYFSRVEVTPRRGLADGLEVPIHVDLVPRKRQRFEVGIGFGTDTGLRGLFDFQLRRLNRQGHQAEGELRVSRIEQSIAAQYILPSRYPSTRAWTFSAGFAHLRPVTSRSDKITARVSQSLSRGEWTEDIGLRFQREAFEVGADTGVAHLLVASADWSHTKADDRIFATRGYRIQFGASGSWDAVLSNASFVQASVHTKLIQPLGDRFRAIFRIDLAGTATTQFRELPPTIRQFAGGDQSVRGFAFRSLGPTDEAGNVIGGKHLLTVSGQLEFKLLRRWGLAAFFDAGNAISDQPLVIEQGTGIGIWWISPVGLIRVDGAFAISRDGPPFRLHIIIGPDF